MPKANRELARMRVVELYGQHLSERAIAKAIHKSQPFVHYWIRHYQLYGHVRDFITTRSPYYIIFSIR